MADPIDELLKQIQEGESPRSSPGSLPIEAVSAPPAKSIDHLLAEVERKSAGNPVCSPEPQAESQKKVSDASPARSLEHLLHHLDSASAASKPTASKPQSIPPDRKLPGITPPVPKVDLQSGTPSAEQAEKRRRAIEQKARAWLDALDPHGGEALFFEKLAEKYADRLQAAIDFLGLNAEAP